MRSAAALWLVAFAGLSTSQSSQQQNYPYTIDPNSVSASDRQTWCSNQVAQCPLICLQQPGVTTTDTVKNDCQPDTLTYSCVCSNNVAPNITQYSQTLPYYICTEWGNQCVKACNGENVCGSNCRAQHPCGAQHPNGPNSSIPTTMSKTAAPAAATSIDTSDFGSSPSKKGTASAMLDVGASYSLAVVLGSVFAGFAIFL